MTAVVSSRRPLGELIEVVGGVVPAKPTDGAHGEPFVGITEISAGGAAAPRYVEADDVPPEAPRLLNGDVAVALMSSIGSTLLIRTRHEGAVLGRECAALRPRTPEIAGSWIYVWTQSEDFVQQVERHVTGTTMPRLSRRALSDFTLPLPDIDTQMEVQALLVEFDGALAKAGQVVADLTELRRIELQLLIADLEAER
jgi:restriction endonuclease S subunit